MSRPLSPAAFEALRTAKATDTTVHLTSGQLAGAVYAEVDKALKRIAGGGRWHVGKHAHVFTRDPRPELAALVAAGAMPIGMGGELSYFRTPDHLADELATRLDLPNGAASTANLLEPSAGDGAIVRALHRAYPAAWIDAVEIDEHRAMQLDAGEVFACSFETFAEVTPEGAYDAVVMNPPFSTPGNPYAYVDHIEAAWRLVRPGGQLLAIAPKGLQFPTTKRIAALRDRIEEDGQIEELPDGTFKEARTDVHAVLVSVMVPGGYR